MDHKTLALLYSLIEDEIHSQVKRGASQQQHIIALEWVNYKIKDLVSHSTNWFEEEFTKELKKERERR